MDQQIITKPWGEEIILTKATLPYTAKIIKIKAGHKLSLQYHDQKDETLCLFSGQCQLVFGPNQNQLETVDMEPFLGYQISPNTVHRLIAISDCQIFEASTPELGTTFRLEDDYHRPDETAQLRNSQRQSS